MDWRSNIWHLRDKFLETVTPFRKVLKLFSWKYGHYKPNMNLMFILAVWPWTSPLNSLGLNFLIYPGGLITTLTFLGCSGLNGGPKCPLPNPWDLWLLPYLGKESLQMYLKLRVLRWNDHLGLSGWALNPMTRDLVRKKQKEIWNKGHEDTHREEMATCRWCRDWSHAATSQGMPGATRSCKRQKGSSPRAFGGNTAWLTPWFQTFSLQNYERINFFYFKLFSLW